MKQFNSIVFNSYSKLSPPWKDKLRLYIKHISQDIMKVFVNKLTYRKYIPSFFHRKCVYITVQQKYIRKEWKLARDIHFKGCG